MKRDKWISAILRTSALLLIFCMLVQPGFCVTDEDRSNSRQWLANGMDQFRRGDFKGAMECLEKSLMYDPQNQDAQFLINEITELAIKELQKGNSNPAVSNTQQSAALENSLEQGQGIQGIQGSDQSSDLSDDGYEQGGFIEAATPIQAAALPEQTQVDQEQSRRVSSRERSQPEQRSSLFGSFMNLRIFGGSSRKNQRDQEQQAREEATPSAKTLAMFNNSAGSIVQQKRDPSLTQAMSNTLGNSGGFKMLSGYFGGGEAQSGSQIQTASAPEREESRNPETLTSVSRVDELNEKGLRYARENKFLQAIDLFNRVLETDPGNLVALNNAALAYAYNDDLYSAIKMYRKIIKLTPPGSRYHKMAQSMIKKLKSII